MIHFLSVFSYRLEEITEMLVIPHVLPLAKVPKGWTVVYQMVLCIYRIIFLVAGNVLLTKTSCLRKDLKTVGFININISIDIFLLDGNILMAGPGSRWMDNRISVVQ